MMLYHYTTFEFARDDILNRHLKVCTLDSVNDPYEWVPCELDSNSEPISADETRKWWCEQYNDKTGFLSFSKSIENPAMWGYYGDKHKGVALGFELGDKLPLEMEYKDERVKIPKHTLEDGTDKQAAYFDELIKRKATTWQHECEFRLLVHIPTSAEKKNGLSFTSLKGFDLQGVFLGYKCSERDAVCMRCTLDSVNLRYTHVYGTKMSDKSFLMQPFNWM